ncbi:RNA-binding protein, CCR4-NOT complex subunit Rcd1 [Microbotryomycetes sp. JL221]|nr:RNA-binding protein, CCR4-NOT complex subunit Rcd1 [Microbotryomycetes sp. JL221]
MFSPEQQHKVHAYRGGGGGWPSSPGQFAASQSPHQQQQLPQTSRTINSSALLNALNGPSPSPQPSSAAAASSHASALLASLNGPNNQQPHTPGHSRTATTDSTINLLRSSTAASSTTAGSSVVGGANGHAGSDSQQSGLPDSPHQANASDPWASSFVPSSISQSLNNPGLPSGVIVSSARADAMNGFANNSRSTDPSGLGSQASALVGGAAGHLGPSSTGTGGGKLLSLVQPGSIPGQSGQSENETVYYLIVDLMSPTTREAALLELSKKREQWDDLALVLWHSFGVMSALLQEIVSVYPLLAPPSLTAHASNRVCNALALLQCVASHNDTRSLFLQAHIPLFLYPFLNTTSKTRPFEYLRLTSLGVIGALVKQNDNSDVINFLLSTEIIPLCLRIMETGSELSKTVAIFIVQKILLDEMGLAYICQTYERFYAVGTVLSNMVHQLVESQAVRLLKHVVRCYLRLSDNLRAREALRACLPEPLRDATFSPLLKGDMVTKRCLATLLLNLSDRVDS